MLTVTASAGAPGGPGALSHFDLARKDCLGTARNTTSKVWYTVANGVLSDVYYPTVDNTNVETLQYVVTDGSTFTDLQTRDMTYTVEALHDTGGMACKVTATAKSGKYRIETDYITDPARNTVLMRVAFTPRRIPSYRLYVRFDPTVNGNGGGGSGQRRRRLGRPSTPRPGIRCSSPPTRSPRRTRRTATTRSPSTPRSTARSREASSGFVGAASDGLVQLDASHALTPTFADATDGNVVQTARGRRSAATARPCSRSGSARRRPRRSARPRARSARRFDKTLGDYKKGWKNYDDSLNKPRTEKLHGLTRQTAKQLEDEYYLSANVIKASEDKTFPGAIVASLASPWGQAISAGDPANTYFGSYREVFARDLYEAWTGLVADGDLATARDATLFLLRAAAAAGRLDAAEQPRQRQDRARLVRDAARRGPPTRS